MVDQITFYNQDDGWSVIKIVPDNPRPPTPVDDGTVTVVGTMLSFREGESVQFTGKWENNKRYGRQFKAHKAIAPLPRTEADIIHYLGSEHVKGIGPNTAKKIVERFGEATIEILDEEPKRVYEIPGLKPAEVQYFLKDWSKNQVQRHALIYLQDKLGLSGRIARQIYSKYGVETQRKIRTDPYLLAADEFLTFEKADNIARKLGVLDGNRGRLRAGLLYAMNHFARDGHTFAPRSGALARAAKILHVEGEGALEEALNDLLDDDRLGEEQFNNDSGAKPTRAIYLPRFWNGENAVANKLRTIANRSSALIHAYRDTNWTQFLFYINSRIAITSRPR